MLIGYRTIIANLVLLLAGWLNTHYQIVIDPNDQVAIVTSVLAIGNIGLRLLTKTPVFDKGAKDGTGDKNTSK